jgi:hypothetical protein
MIDFLHDSQALLRPQLGLSSFPLACRALANRLSDILISGTFSECMLNINDISAGLSRGCGKLKMTSYYAPVN